MAKNTPPRKQDLYQVTVENTQTGNVQFVGPAMLKEACEQFAHVIREQIRLGREKTWANPLCTKVLNLH